MDRFYGGGTAQVRVFKAMYNDLVNPFALRYLQRQKDIRVLHLRRENLLKVYVSRLLMIKRETLHVFEPVEAIQTYVDPAKAIAYIDKARTLYARFDARFAGHPLLPVCYEEMIDGALLRADVAANVCDFLGVDRFPMKSRQVKRIRNRYGKWSRITTIWRRRSPARPTRACWPDLGCDALTGAVQRPSSLSSSVTS